MFCEALAVCIAQDIAAACNPLWCKVTVTQKPRGGITITATAGTGDCANLSAFVSHSLFGLTLGYLVKRLLDRYNLAQIP